jgi:flagellar hook-basal body complex protein FliE
MIPPISPITAPIVANVTPVVKAVAPSGAAGFSSILTDAVGRMDQSTKSAEGGVDRFLSGENEEIHGMVLETQRNELQFQLFLAVRTKVVAAYQEVMRMQM